MKNCLVLKSLFIVIAFMFCCSITYAEEGKKECDIKIQMIGGKTIKTGTHAGEAGYAWAEIDEGERIVSGVRYYWCHINCSGKGVNPCPKQQGSCSPRNPKIEDEIVAIIHDNIDMGKIAGEFVYEEFLCKWDNGEKNTNEETGIPIYGYELTIILEKDKNPDIFEYLSIYVAPNPVPNDMTVHFSMDIDAEMFVKIIDFDSNIRWKSNMYISGNKLNINNLDYLNTGTYIIICTNEKHTISTNFIKK